MPATIVNRDSGQMQIEGKGFDVVATFDAEGTVEKKDRQSQVIIIQANPDIKAIFSH